MTIFIVPSEVSIVYKLFHEHPMHWHKLATPVLNNTQYHFVLLFRGHFWSKFISDYNLVQKISLWEENN